MWGKLGYPRRALRLHECAVALVERSDGQVPADVEALRGLPGVGEYTARAVAAFAFGKREPVVDTNVRRVVARLIAGHAEAGPPSAGRDHRAVSALLPDSPRRAARVSVALMELGALVCTARAPRCSACPLRTSCAWRLAGSPDYDGPRSRRQRFTGTDRQVRGLLLDVLRASAGPVERAALDVVWADAAQRDRALDTLIVDGLIDPLPDGRYALPGSAARPTA
jgi:A/G-specific adenine glycosylase